MYDIIFGVRQHIDCLFSCVKLKTNTHYFLWWLLIVTKLLVFANYKNVLWKSFLQYVWWWRNQQKVCLCVFVVRRNKKNTFVFGLFVLNVYAFCWVCGCVCVNLPRLYVLYLVYSLLFWVPCVICQEIKLYIVGKYKNTNQNVEIFEKVMLHVWLGQ